MKESFKDMVGPMDHYQPEPNTVSHRKVIRVGAFVNRSVSKRMDDASETGRVDGRPARSRSLVSLLMVDRQLNRNMTMKLPPVEGFVGCPFNRRK